MKIAVARETREGESRVAMVPELVGKLTVMVAHRLQVLKLSHEISEQTQEKIDVIKVIRQLTSRGLGEAKTLAETAGGKVLTGVGKDAANEAKKKLEEAGAAADIK